MLSFCKRNGERRLGHTAISRKVVGKNMHATIPKGNMGYDQYNVPNDCSYRTYFCCFPLALANICPWPLVPFFQFSLEKRAGKNHPQYLSGLSRALFRQPFSKQLYLVEGGGIQHFQIKLKFWHYTTNKFDLQGYRHKHMKLFINIVMKRIYLFDTVAWIYRKKIGFSVCKK